MKSSLQINDSGLISIFYEDKCLFNGTAQELAKVENGQAIRECIDCLNAVIGTLEDELGI